MERMPSFDLRCLLVVVPAVLSLAGCATPDPVAHPCPTFGVLSDAETLTAFGSGSQEPTNVMYRAMLGNASLDCRYKGLKLPRNRTPVGQPDLRISPGMGPSGEGGGYLGSELLVPKQASSSVCQSDW